MGNHPLGSKRAIEICVALGGNVAVEPKECVSKRVVECQARRGRLEVLRGKNPRIPLVAHFLHPIDYCARREGNGQHGIRHISHVISVVDLDAHLGKFVGGETLGLGLAAFPLHGQVERGLTVPKPFRLPHVLPAPLVREALGDGRGEKGKGEGQKDSAHETLSSHFESVCGKGMTGWAFAGGVVGVVGVLCVFLWCACFVCVFCA